MTRVSDLLLRTLSATVVSVAVPGGASAQSAPQSPPMNAADVAATTATPVTPPEVESMDDIVVTAQRRAQNLRDVPISITAISPARAEQLNLRDVGALQQVTPGLVFSNGINYASTFIRGIGAQLPNPGIEPSVATYIDGSYVEHAFGSVFDILDPESIQVLKGPQGSLYGRNASGGVVLITTADPAFDWGGRAMVEAGNLDHQIVEGTLNAPVSDTFALRFSGRYRNDGGYVRNLVDGFKLGGRETWTLRGKARFRPNADFNAVLQVQYDRAKRSQGPGAQYLSARYCLLCRTSAYTFPLADPYTTVGNTLNGGRGGSDKNIFVNLKMDYDFGPVAVNSVTSYRDLDAFEVGDFDGTEIDGLNIANRTKAKTWTQDITLTTDFDGMLNFIGGGNYLYDDSDFDLGFPTAAQLPDFPAFISNTIKTESISAFVDGTLEPLKGLKIIVGGRYTRDRREVARGSIRFNRFTKRFVLSYDTGLFNFYGSYNDGFKAGGVNAAIPDPLTAPFQPERMKGYEIGSKFVSSDRRLRANLALFTYKNRGLQIPSVNQDDPSNIADILNADAKGRGVEFDADYKPSDNFQIFTGASYLDSKFLNFLFPQALLPNLDANGNPQTGIENLSGRRLIRAPKWSFFVGATVTGDISNEWKAELTGFVRYSSSFDFQAGAGGPLRTDLQPGFTTARANFAVMPQDERYQIAFYVENLTNKVFYDFRFGTPPFGSLQNVARPRTYGVRLSTRF